MAISTTEEYVYNINTIIEICQQKSIRIIFLTQPFIWRPDLTQQEKDLCWFGFSGDSNFWYSLEALIAGLEQYNSALINVCKERGVEAIDLENILPKDTTVFYDDIHFNENGSVMVADALFDYLAQKEPFIVSHH